MDNEKIYGADEIDIDSSIREKAFLALCKIRQTMPGMYGYALNEFNKKHGQLTCYELDIVMNGRITVKEVLIDAEKIQLPRRAKITASVNGYDYSVEIDEYDVLNMTPATAISYASKMVAEHLARAAKEKEANDANA